MDIKRKHLNLLYSYSYKKKQMEQIFSIKAKEKMQASTQEQSVGSALVSGLNKKKKNTIYSKNKSKTICILPLSQATLTMSNTTGAL